MIKDDEVWVTLTKYLVNLLKMKYKQKHGVDKIEHEDVVSLLLKQGIDITNAALRKKVSRGRFSAQFLLQLIVALNVDLSSAEIKQVLDSSKLTLLLKDKASVFSEGSGTHTMRFNMLKVVLNAIDAAGRFPDERTMLEFALIFPYRRRLESDVKSKLKDDDLFTISLFDQLSEAEKESEIEDFELFINQTCKSL
tara:strand:+ start:106 stop:690 length:585 start_codon:yes stop_codon:yes gene_type:complete